MDRNNIQQSSQFDQNENQLLQEIQNDSVLYICAYCGKDVDLKPKENIVRCKECAYRILFKKRTRNLMQYEAR